MDKIQKALNRLFDKERKRTKSALKKLKSGNTRELDIKKLKNRTDIFRLRLGGLRIIYQTRNDKMFILQISRRNENTYK